MKQETFIREDEKPLAQSHGEMSHAATLLSHMLQGEFYAVRLTRRWKDQYAHEQGKALPEYIGIISDALILNPWDREIIQEGKFVFHPEYVHALAQQGMVPDPSLLLGIDPLPLAKGS